MRENEEYRPARLSGIRSPSVYLAAALGHFALLSKLRLARRSCVRAFSLKRRKAASRDMQNATAADEAVWK